MHLSHIADMRDYRKVEDFRQETHTQKLAHPRHPRAIHLYEGNRPGLHEVLEQDAIRDMLSSCDLDWAYGTGELHMRLYIIGVRGFFDPKRVKLNQLPADAKRIGKVPPLIGIQHESVRVTNEL